MPEMERQTATHVKELGKVGFTSDRRTVCSIAYSLLVSLTLHINSRRTNWPKLFMDRNSDTAEKGAENGTEASDLKANNSTDFVLEQNTSTNTEVAPYIEFLKLFNRINRMPHISASNATKKQQVIF